VAGLAVLGIDDFLHSILSVESDSMIVALCLAAADCIVCRRHRWAFWVWWLAALGRPAVPAGGFVGSAILDAGVLLDLCGCRCRRG